MGNQITGEMFHILSVDHPSPLQNHWKHDFGEDGCDDTSGDPNSENLVSCNYGVRDALTQCQIGRMHRFLAEAQPGYERFPDGNGGWSMTPVSLPLPCAISEPDIVIPDGADIIWNGSVNLRSNILVESGGKLTITCNIGMPANARITVQTGGRLVVDGARIYNTCPGTFWDGIVVEGDADFDQTNIGGIKQGYVQLKPGSVIEGAYIGVRLFDPSTPQNTAGGIISANGATFYNNTGGVAIARYQGTNPITGNPLGYNATFTGCRFLVDENIGGGLGSFAYMANLHGVDGVRFNGCTFANDFPSDQATYADNMGYGIKAWDAGFSIEGDCLGNTFPCQSYQRSVFRGFQTAVYAQNTGGTASTFRVSRCDFEDNARGIVSSSVHNIFVALNTFKVGMGIPYQYTNNPFVGIQVLRGTGFTIEENELEPATVDLAAETQAVGITIVESGTEKNEVYKNNLIKLYVGNLANGKNRNSQLPNTGLQYLCNMHADNEFDIAVPSKSWMPGNIAANQGSLDLSAGNFFTDRNPGPQGQQIKNELNPLEYFFTQGPLYEPVNITPVNVTTTLIFKENACESNLLGNGDGIILKPTNSKLKRTSTIQPLKLKGPDWPTQ
ncbi:MAG: hypothetical protein R2788_01240 [Saprospiraceae bacterium]